MAEPLPPVAETPVGTAVMFTATTDMAMLWDEAVRLTVWLPEKVPAMSVVTVTVKVLELPAGTVTVAESVLVEMLVVIVVISLAVTVSVMPVTVLLTTRGFLPRESIVTPTSLPPGVNERPDGSVMDTSAREVAPDGAPWVKPPHAVVKNRAIRRIPLKNLELITLVPTHPS